MVHGLFTRSARVGCEEFAECRRDRFSAGGRGRSGRRPAKLFETEKLDIRCVCPGNSWPRHANFLGEMAAWPRRPERTGEQPTGRERWSWERGVYDVWESKSNFRSFVNFVCSKSTRLKGSSQPGMKFFCYPRKLNGAGYSLGRGRTVRRVAEIPLPRLVIAM